MSNGPWPPSICFGTSVKHKAIFTCTYRNLTNSLLLAQREVLEQQMLTKENANLVRFRFHWKARLGNFAGHRGDFLLKKHTSFFVFLLKMDIFKGLWFLIFSILNFLLNSCFWLQYWLIHHVCMFWLYDFQNEKLAFVLKQLQTLTWLPLIHHQGINQEMKERKPLHAKMQPWLCSLSFLWTL